MYTSIWPLSKHLKQFCYAVWPCERPVHLDLTGLTVDLCLCLLVDLWMLNVDACKRGRGHVPCVCQFKYVCVVSNRWMQLCHYCSAYMSYGPQLLIRPSNIFVIIWAYLTCGGLDEGMCLHSGVIAWLVFLLILTIVTETMWYICIHQEAPQTARSHLTLSV